MTTTQPVPRSGIGGWLYERFGLKGIAYPVPVHANSLPYVLGGITVTGFVILFITGIYLAQFYHPEPADAHQSVVYLITSVPLGDLVRSVHFWMAQIVTLTVLLHMLRVLFTGAYKRPREINWLVGLTLLAIRLGFVFTGSVLKFDQEGLEALQHNKEAASLVGSLGAWFSPEFSRGVPLIVRLFNAHITILPPLFIQRWRTPPPGQPPARAARLFALADEVEAAWEIVEPVIKKRESEKSSDFPDYTVGSAGPATAAELLARDGRRWYGSTDQAG